MNLANHKWLLAVSTVTLLLTLPIWVLVSYLFVPTNDNWAHLVETLLAEYIINSLWLMLGVSFGTLLIGVSTAWLISQYRFFGHTFLQWALLLPIAIPAYIIAYTYTGLLEFEGPVQSYLRTLFAPQTVNNWFPEIRSLGGAMLMFSLVLYPYIYLLSRSAFSNHSQQALDAAKTLGAGPIRRFFSIALPMARPAIIAGLTLALMETLADFGTVQHFGVSTFTTGIYRTWTGFGDTTTTAQLALVLLVFILMLITLEIWSRKQARFYSSDSIKSIHIKRQLTGWQGFGAFAWCFTPLLLGFLLPSLQLLYWAITTADTQLDSSFIQLIWNSFYLACIAAIVALIIALFLAYAKRINPNKQIDRSVRIAGLGYAIPGTVIAIAVMIPLAWIDNTLDQFMTNQFGISTGLVLSGTLFALVFAYSFRFLSVSLQTIDSGLNQVKPVIDESARTLGASHWQVISKIHFPMIRSSLLIAFLLVFVEVLKELPTTLILRPFNFNTLSVKAYEMAADERLADAGLPALLIVLTGIIPVIILSKLIGKPDAKA
ncbi:MAG: iron ABC transporter permease [Thiomicrorhabdus sp.]|nr:iron ABC transporter permease [Thiomicrorhabdus sp.]